MRLFLLGVLLLGGCRTSELPHPSDGGGDLAASGADLATGGGNYDLMGALCVSACNRCLQGACCGQICCGSGEWCDIATFTCHCGQGASCTGGSICAIGVMQAGSNGCGNGCCGTAGNICPM